MDEVALSLYHDVLDSLILDVASESHRAAKLGFDYRLSMNEEEELRLSEEGRRIASESSGERSGVDMFGQKHPAVAADIVDCMNCGRPVAAGRFAPHLEKCMGKGRKARLRSAQPQPQQQRKSLRSGRTFQDRQESTPEDDEDDE